MKFGIVLKQDSPEWQNLTFMAESFIREHFPDKKSDPDKVQRLLLKCCYDSKGLLLHTPRGFICGVEIEHPFLNTGKVLQEIAWYVKPDFRQSSEGSELLKAFEKIATYRRCSSVVLSTLSNSYDLVGEYLEKGRGYKHTESTYIKEL